MPHCLSLGTEEEVAREMPLLSKQNMEVQLLNKPQDLWSNILRTHETNELRFISQLIQHIGCVSVRTPYNLVCHKNTGVCPYR